MLTKKRFLCISGLCLLFLSSACTSNDPEPAPVYPDLVVTMERTMCLGTCPTYTLTIYGDKTLVYEGRIHVATEGTITTTVSLDQIEQLVTAFEKAEFFNLDNGYNVGCRDLPSHQ